MAKDRSVWETWRRSVFSSGCFVADMMTKSNIIVTSTIEART